MVKNRNYLPEKGDIIWLSFSPTKGHEQSGRRPGLVISDKSFNQTSMALVVPITSALRKYETHVSFQTENINGTVLCDHIRSIDWSKRDVAYIGPIPGHILSKVKNIVASLILS